MKMKKIIMTCILFASLFLGVCFGFKSNAYSFTENGNLISDNVLSVKDGIYGSDSAYVEVKDGVIHLYKTATYNINIFIPLNVPVKSNTTYSFLAFENYTGFQFFLTAGNNDYTNRIRVDTGSTFSVNYNIIYVQIYMTESSRFSNFELRPMLNEGTTAKPYEPYGVWYSQDNYDKFYDLGYDRGYDAGYVDGKAYYDTPEYLYGNLYNCTWSWRYQISTNKFSDMYDMGFLPSEVYKEQGIDITFLYKLADKERISKNLAPGVASGGGYELYFNVFGENTIHSYTISGFTLYGNVSAYTLSFLDNSNFVAGRIVANALLPLPQTGISTITFTSSYTTCVVALFDNTSDNNSYGYLSNSTGIDMAVSESIRQSGYNNGYDVGYDKGFDAGNAQGKKEGYQRGYDQGYTDGSGSDNTLVGMMFAIVDAPFQILKESLNFNFLGVNISEFIFSLITLIVVLKIFSMFF